jgi:hypothetical protein
VNYLTFDPWYRDSHECEYILSTPERPIIELVYSPLVSTGWVWKYQKSEMTRKSWLEKMNLAENLTEKIWIPIFCYPETILNLNLEDIPTDVHLFFIGNISSRLIPPPRSYHFPWLSRDDLWTLIDLADISVLRGEISSLRWLMSGKPYLWDMYKWVWWWNEEESDHFVDFIDASEKYREIHTKINTGSPWNIEEIISLIDDPSEISLEKIPDFRETLEKTIDKMGFSL